MTVTGFLSQLLQLAIALLLAPLLVGWVNKCRAWLANRTAPSLILPYRMIRKLFHKNAVVAENASPIFRATPYIVFSAMALAAAIVPSLATDLPFARAADAIALVGLFALARVFIALAAMDIGTAFGSMGARREMFVGFLAEPALLMVFFTASLLSGSTSLPTIVETLLIARSRSTRALPSRAWRSRCLAGRECAHSNRQSGNAPRAHHDPRGDDARVFRAAPGADRMGFCAEAVQLLVHRHRAVPAFRHRPGQPDWFAILGATPVLVAKLAVGGSALALIETLSAKLRIFPRARVPGHGVPARRPGDAGQPAAGS